MPEPVQAMLEDGQLSLGHAKALMALDSPEVIMNLAERIVEKSLSVRQTEDAITNRLHPVQELEKQMKALAVDPNVKEAERELERALGVRVTITDRKGKGKILLEYSSLEDFDRIVGALGRN